MKLYHFPRTRSSRVLWAANELGVELELESVNLLEGEQFGPGYEDKHPHHKVPAFEDPANNLHMIESGAIAVWLQETADKDGKLIPPPGTVARARYWEWMFYTTATLDGLTIPTYLHSKVVPEDLRDRELVAEKSKIWRENVAPFLAKRLGDNQWACGDTFSLADVFLGFNTVLAADMGLLAGHGNLLAYTGRVTTRDAFKAAFS